MAVYHQYSIWQIAVWILHWQAQHIWDKAPYISPTAEYGGPPTWWYQFYSEWTWWQNIGAYHIPTPTVISYAMRGTWRLIGLWVDEVGNWANDTAQSAARGWVGWVRSGLTTFSSWIYYLEGITGIWVPWWATNLADGVTRLYMWLPSDIRTALTTWSDKFLAATGAANAWAWGQFQAARNWVANTAPGLLSGYNTVRGWYDAVATWLTNFKNNPYGTVVGWLGAAWTWVVNFKNDPYGTVVGWLGAAWGSWLAVRWAIRDFHTNVWSPFKADIFAFFDHPMQFLYDKTEDFLCERW